MATPVNDDTKRLFRFLSDGKWHPYNEIRQKIADTVPPGRALRKYEDRIKYKRIYNNDPDYDTTLSEDERIFFGARACAQIVITSWKDRGIELSGTMENKRIRRTPGFSTWGIEALPDDPVEPELGEVVPEVPPDDSEPSDDSTAGPQSPVEPVEVAAEAEPVYPEAPVLEDPPWMTATSLRELSQPVAESDLPPDLPTCDRCGSWVAEQAAHDAWHITQESPPQRDDMALFSESDVRRLLEEVVSTQLDYFQGGLQQYLTTQFSQLEGIIAAVSGLPWRAAGKPDKPTH